MTKPLADLPAAFRAGHPQAITSVCSAHPLVIEAALRLARERGGPVLIEATCNQVNQEGGYTGLTPQGFFDFVARIAGEVGLDMDQVIFGGDHLGPNPWTHLPAEEAMARAEVMVAGFAAAGFTKLHLDTSMGCAGEPLALDDTTIAGRAARLAAAAEANCGAVLPVYIVGTEVPVPGGALEALDDLAVTTPRAARRTYQIHRQTFVDAGLTEAFGRVIGLVVQPGVEFGHADVVRFVPDRAEALSASLAEMPGIVFEAHSTDYQHGEGLSALAGMGFAILKVGPWLTFALREALYGLDAIADVLEGQVPQGRLMARMEALMQAAPDNWARYYTGVGAAGFVQRHFSYSDRIRYYWPQEQAEAAVGEVMARLEGRAIPAPVLRQYLPDLQLPGPPGAVTAQAVLLEAVQQVLRLYAEAGQRRAA